MPDAAGAWRGIATQTGAIFDYALALTTTGGHIEGTSTLSRISRRPQAAPATFMI